MLLVVLEHGPATTGARPSRPGWPCPTSTRGRWSMPLLRAVAERAAAVGAPPFAANLWPPTPARPRGPGWASTSCARPSSTWPRATWCGRGWWSTTPTPAAARAPPGFTGPRWVAVRSGVRGASDDGSGSVLSAFDALATEGARDVAAAWGSIAGPGRCGRERRAQGSVARARSMREVMAAVDDVAPANTTVLLLGESGTGKEVFARSHPRPVRAAAGPWVAVNCAGPAGRAAGERAVRSRAGRLHRRHRAAHRPHRAGRPRDPAPRRDLRDAAAAAGEAAARPAGA
jgi:hypothetical protein